MRLVMAKSIILAFSIFCFSISHAEIYKYVDTEGTIHFTNVPTDKQFISLQITKPLPQKGARVKKKNYTLNRSDSYSESRILKNIHKEIDSVSKRYNVEASLVKAVIMAESDFDPSAISPAGAMGLMQLMPRTADYMGVYNPFDPIENLVGGVKYLRYLLDIFEGDVVLALAAYNAGEDVVRRYNNVPPYAETRNYVKKVLKYYWNSYR